MKQDQIYIWWCKKYASLIETQLGVANRRGAGAQDQLLNWLDTHFSDFALVLLRKYGLEFINGLVEDFSS